MEKNLQIENWTMRERLYECLRYIKIDRSGGFKLAVCKCILDFTPSVLIVFFKSEIQQFNSTRIRILRKLPQYFVVISITQDAEGGDDGEDDALHVEAHDELDTEIVAASARHTHVGHPAVHSYVVHRKLCI